MKKLCTLFTALLFTAIVFAQVPQKMSYQAVIRNSTDKLVTSHAVGMQISILQGSETGAVVYTETQTTTTNINGLVTIEIGGGAGFNAINWANGPYFLKTETDPTGGTTYTISGTSQLLCVPYALHAKTVASYIETDPIFVAWNKSSGISVTASQVSDFTTSVTNNAAMIANTAKNTYPAADSSKLAAITGTNTGDQNLANVLTQGTDAGNKKIINVNQQGIGTATPNASSALEISSTTQGFLPPRMTQAQKDSITPVEGLIVYNITTKKPNYYNGFEWKNYDGTSANTPAVGNHYQGGILAYILQSGDPGYIAGETHGLIVAPSDQSTGSEWGCFGTTISGADGTAIGTGAQNTIDIVTGCTTAGIAAKLCYDLTLNGYSDWYLPSMDELNKLYLNKVAIGGFTVYFYWSSSEYNLNGAWTQNFAIGAQDGNFPKSNTFYVRAVRTF